MIRAMWRLRLYREMTRETYARNKSMLFSGLPIAGQIGDERPRRFVIQHVRARVEKRMKADRLRGSQSLQSEQETETPILDWLVKLSFDDVVTWLIENWQVIAQILAGLMVFLEAEYESE